MDVVHGINPSTSASALMFKGFLPMSFASFSITVVAIVVAINVRLRFVFIATHARRPPTDV